MAMSKQHLDALTKNRVALVKNVIIDEELLAFMMAEKSIITENMKEEIEAKSTRSAKVSKLLEILIRRGPDAMSVFIYALVYTHQEAIANLLDTALSKKYITQRDCELDPNGGSADYMEVDSGPSEEPEKSLAEKLAEITAGNENLLVPVHRLNSSDPIVSHLCRQMEHGSVYNIRSNCRGRVVIISCHYFVRSDLLERTGNVEDVGNLKKLFEEHLQFEVKIYDGLDRQGFDSCIEKERRSGKLNIADMFVFIVLSHGKDEHFYLTDGNVVSINQVVEKFDGKNCPALYDKPKLFFIQACQGAKTTIGSLLQTQNEADGPSGHDETDHDEVDAIDPNPLPTREPTTHFVGLGVHESADRLIGKASVSGFAANRNEELGTLYIRCIVYVFSRKAHKDHVEDMLTEVANIMSAFKTKKNEVFMSEKKGTLRKRLYFMPGFNGQR